MPRLVESGARVPSISSVSGSFSARMTILHPIPGQSLLCQTDQVQGWWCSTPGVQLLFFKPLADGITRHTEGALQTTLGTTFFIGTENLFALLCGVTIGLRVLTAAALTIFTPETLYTIAGVAVSHQMFTIAVTTFEGDDNHAQYLLSSHPTCPLPERVAIAGSG